ncbi:2 beta-glucan [Auriculariales sp. MPI-PUGE-AT-0066]|nr:2 beta-glucan [Auriculariales sp. MPI-PUGE-AT-0066]
MFVSSRHLVSPQLRTARLGTINQHLTDAFIAGKYNSKEVFIGDGFYNGFNFYNGDDPTHGRVDYVDMGTAQSMNLTSSSADTFITRVDTGGVDPASRGRKAVRLESKNQYENHVLVADIRHMPEGTPTWPALWEFGDGWPNLGELDILEGANDNGPNLASLHTSAGCIQPMGGRDMKGTAVSDNCDVAANGNQGCGVKMDSPESYGPAFNGAGGGWVAVERSNDYIKVWFWGRNDGAVPGEVRDNVQGVNPDTWGQPTALFDSSQCPLNDKFGPNKIVINTSLCGDWAGNTYPGGMQACIDAVNSGGDWTGRAYWEFARIAVYV